MKKLILALCSLGKDRNRRSIKARPLESEKDYNESKGEYVFQSLVTKNKLIYLNLCEDGGIQFNIDCPEIKKWEYDENLKKVILKNIDGLNIGEISELNNQTALLLNGERYVQSRTHYQVDDAFYDSIKEDLRELHINKCTEIDFASIKSFINDKKSIRDGILWFNKSSPIKRKSSSPLSIVDGETTEYTEKWQKTLNATNNGLTSPNIFLLFLKDAYILNGSLVFSRGERLVKCTQQLAATLGPHTSFYPAAARNSMHSEHEYRPEINFKEAIRLEDDKIFFLYGNCHWGFGHHLGQATPSAYFINRIVEKYPELQQKIIAIHRGGLSSEEFRKDLYCLSLDKAINCRSLTSGLYRIKNLIVPSTLQNMGNHWFKLKSLWNNIRDKAKSKSTFSKIDFQKYRGIYLSRSGYNRNCINANEFSRLLKDLKFFEYSPPETLSFVDQIALMSKFNLFVAPYGSGACNILFGDEKSHLISNLCSYSNGQIWDYSNCQMMGHDYTYVFSRPIDPSVTFHERQYKFNLEIYEKIIKTLLEKEAK
jgi:hypothetical protein